MGRRTSITGRFALNDEVNMAILDRELAATIEGDFAEDLKQSCPLTLEALRSGVRLGLVERGGGEGDQG